ncbi:hypothetical protein ['Camptotheca acuminata' phytoplasma]|uniref:hypothetical protein n=1 Tax='Camptotheca acuminata' phytoplasma TaxID=3239192 RepID=UPI00351A0729
MTQKTGIAIVPETFINSKFNKNNINRIVIIESNPFEDATIPICVVCFNGQKNEQQIIYKNDKKIGLLKDLLKFKNLIQIKNDFLKSLKFNDILGAIALLGVDSTNLQKKIKFINKANLSYDLKNVKISSRAITVINSNILNTLTSQKITQTIEKANKILNDFRQKTEDVLLTPFKGNNSLKQRRRRLDFTLASQIITQAFLEVENLNS